MGAKQRKIGIIGHFGGNENISDGQTIKTKILYEELYNATGWDIIKVDTYYKNKNLIKLLKDTMNCLMHTKDVIILLSRNGMKIYFPLLYYFSKVFNYRIYHDVIGGNLDLYVKRYPQYKRYLNSFCVNWVETEGLKDKLSKQGIANCEVLPNFKRLNIVQDLESEFKEPYRFCTFSRVMKEKGIEDAINAVNELNRKAKKIICKLDIYGKVDDRYKYQFQQILENNKNVVEYKGCVAYNESVNSIRSYYALLFPTYWDGEGFPGTLVDAFAAGIPSIVSDWNCNSEIIENNKNGILYPNSECENLEDAMNWMIENRDKIFELKKNCIRSAKKYQPEKHIEMIIEKLVSK